MLIFLSNARCSKAIADPRISTFREFHDRNTPVNLRHNIIRFLISVAQRRFIYIYAYICDECNILIFLVKYPLRARVSRSRKRSTTHLSSFTTAQWAIMSIFPQNYLLVQCNTVRHFEPNQFHSNIIRAQCFEKVDSIRTYKMPVIYLMSINGSSSFYTIKQAFICQLDIHISYTVKNACVTCCFIRVSRNSFVR